LDSPVILKVGKNINLPTKIGEGCDTRWWFGSHWETHLQTSHEQCGVWKLLSSIEVQHHSDIQILPQVTCSNLLDHFRLHRKHPWTRPSNYKETPP
jgi:hypothetical protein